MASPLSLPFSIPLPFIFQGAKESIDEEDFRPTSSNGACITNGVIALAANLSLVGGDVVPVEAPFHPLRPCRLPLPRVGLTPHPTHVLCAPSLLPHGH